MKIAIWKPEYSVGVKLIDEDHQKLFDLLNQLFESMKKGKGKEVINGIISELERYTVFHFGREESYFRITNYPLAPQHIEQHLYFKLKVAELKKDVASNKGTVAPDALGFLSDWLRNHILKSDKAYEEHFKNHGVV